MKLPQIIHSLPIEQYHKWDGFLSKTTLAMIGDQPACPARFKAWVDGLAPRVDKKVFRIGNAAHVATMEPELFDNQFHIIPDGMIKNAKHTSPGLFGDELKKAAGRTILHEHEKKEVLEMGRAMRDHPIAGPLMDDCLIETTILWERPSGVRLKQRPDLLNVNRARAIDIKTAESCDPEAFIRSAHDNFYDLSVALCAEAYQHVFEEPLEDYLFLVIEKKPPYLISVFSAFKPFDTLGSTYARHGEYRLHNIIETYERCASEDHWPAYCDDIEPMTIPDWKLRQLDRQLNEELQ